MKSVGLVLAVAGALAAGSGIAADGAEVAKAKGCLNCHEMDKKKVGPSVKDVTAKYKGDKGAEAALIAKLKEGKGHMKASASDAELKSAVEFFLSAK